MADKEQARETRQRPGRRPPAETKKLTERRALELSLARIREQLPKVRGADRRRALEAARAELESRLKKL